MEIGFRILWTDSAINQLKDIFDFHFIRAGSNIAQRLIQKIIDATIILENNPKSGRKEDLLKLRPQSVVGTPHAAKPHAACRIPHTSYPEPLIFSLSQHSAISYQHDFIAFHKPYTNSTPRL